MVKTTKSWEITSFTAVNKVGQTTVVLEFDHETQQFNISESREESVRFKNLSLNALKLKKEALNAAINHVIKQLEE